MELSPRPGAIAIGAFAKNPTVSVAAPLIIQVTAIRAFLSIPAALKMAGFTEIM